MDDNTRPNRIHIVDEFHSEANIDRLNGLSRSPNHNSIQYVWDGLRKAISQPNSLPWTPCELKVPLLLPQILIETLINSTVAHCEA
ncbi:hypothetical protein TNCV_2454251 [Trichonephila clavipes]|nr:hypothetical protein TNCV_2454251 [Trichonephila clavipes]